MNTNRIKVLGLLGLPLLAIAIAVMVFAIGNSSVTTEAADFTPAMSLRVDAGQTFDCAGGPTAGKVCIPLGAKFDVIVVADGIPADGYILASAWIDYDSQGLVFNPQAQPEGFDGATALWPDISLATQVQIDNGAVNGAATGGLTGLSSPPKSNHKGDIYSFSFTCTSSQSTSTLDLIAAGTAPAGTSGALYKTAATGNPEVVPALTGLVVNCNPGPTNTPTSTPPPIPRMSKVPALSNHFLVRQSAGKIPPVDCLAGTPTTLSEQLSQTIVSGDPSNPSVFQQLAAFEFEVHYDATKVCVTITVGDEFAGGNPITGDPPGPGICIVQDRVSKPELEGVARIGCVTVGKGHDIDELVVLATVDVYPQPEVYSQAKPNQDNGVVVQINNVNCDLGDEQGKAIPIFSCDDADITFRYLEGDVFPDCVIDVIDAQAIAFRWGVEKGSLIYKDFMNLEPSNQQQDNDIDINDLQFVYGRFGSTCADPHPPQDPVNPKA